MKPKLVIRRTSIRRRNMPRSQCAVCGLNGNHLFEDQELGAVCEGCLVPLMAAERALHEENPKNQSARNRKP